MRALWLTLALMLALPMTALAHAQLRGSDPAQGEMLAEMPDAVTLHFNEAVAPLVLRWIGPDGSVSDVPAESRGESLFIMPPATIKPGTHFLSWRVASGDGHPVGGTLGFHIGTATMQAARTDPATTAAAQVGVGARALLTLALAVALGALLLPALIGATQPDRALRQGGLVAVALGAGAGVTLLAAEGLNLLSLPPAALFTPGPWQAVQGAPLAEAVVAIGLALGLAALGLVQPLQDRGQRLGLGLGAWALGAGSFALSGHGATAEPQIVAQGALVLHGGALLFWIGALWPLLRLIRSADGALALARFSTLAIPMVALLILSGLALLWLQMGGALDLFGTDWGLILSAKLVAVAGLLGLALRNRLVLMPALGAGNSGASPRMARAIRAEIVLAVMIVILASGLRLVPPPRALAGPEAPIHVHLHDPRVMADLQITPESGGQLMLTMGFQSADFGPLAPREVNLVLALPADGIEPLRIAAALGPDGLWQAGPLSLPVPGLWEVTLRVLITDFESVTLRESVRIVP